ncbi:MAG: RuvB-like domain-containing protein [Candidatus Aenigmarchaeota archaeon]|nr:RuvB-like domain-containing protein [Candidatus Aenigmarchaeota archaeon]MDW8149804.1 RuvB-like domain-containing protein [Candidatus Aenigmarchaeota archaeon]
MPEVREIIDSGELKEFERIAAHSHIKGLGLKDLKAEFIADGFVGQEEAREAAGIVVRMIKEGKFAGKGVLLAGVPGSGKTALAIGIARELGKDVPFVHLAASEIYSAEVKKTEFLTQALRKSIGVRIREMRKIYEGEVVELDIKHKPHHYNPYYQIPVGATIKLESKEESKKLNVDQSFAIQIVQQGIEVGDVVGIDVDGGRVVKYGKSERVIKKGEEELYADKPVPLPEGRVFKEKEFVYLLTLHQLDMMRAKSSLDIASLLFGAERKEIDSEVRKETEELVKEMIKEGKAELVPGVIFIDECSLLDIETFSFLNRAMEQELAPIIIFATNRGVATIRGTDYKSPHAMPIDLLDRLLIINTRPYTEKEIREIIKIRVKVEKVDLDEEAIEYLTKLGVNSSLRYALQLIVPASIIANKKKVGVEDVKRVEKLFSDIKRSVEYVKEFEKKLLEY